MDSRKELRKIKIDKQVYLNEIIRIAKEAGTYPVAVSGDDYNKKCKFGYKWARALYYVGINYNDAIKETGMTPKPMPKPSKGKVRKGKGMCEGEEINLSDCVPGNREGCKTCEHAIDAPIRIDPNLSEEESRHSAINTSRHLNGAEDLYSMEF